MVLGRSSNPFLLRLQSVPFFYEESNNFRRQLRQFLRAITHDYAGAKFKPTLFLAFVHTLSVGPQRRLGSANKCRSRIPFLVPGLNETLKGIIIHSVIDCTRRCVGNHRMQISALFSSAEQAQRSRYNDRGVKSERAKVVPHVGQSTPSFGFVVEK